MRRVLRTTTGGKPLIRGRRLAVEHILTMLKAGDDEETILQGYSWLDRDDVRACVLYDQMMEHDEDWTGDRAWSREVEQDVVECQQMSARYEPYPEWTEFVEPAYDSEEDMRTMTTLSCLGMTGYV